jgi:hypothetical protein
MESTLGIVSLGLLIYSLGYVLFCCKKPSRGEPLADEYV